MLFNLVPNITRLHVSQYLNSLYRADFSEPLEPVVEPEATFVWKGEEGGGLKLDKVRVFTEEHMSVPLIFEILGEEL